MSGGFNKVTEASILSGSVSASRVEDALTRILTQLFKVGVFDRKDYGVPCARNEKNCDNDVRSEASDALNRKFAEGSTVLLKNEGGILPLGLGMDGQTLGVVGDANNVKGGGSGSVWSTEIVTPTDGIIALLQKTAAKTAAGSAAAEAPPLPAECKSFNTDASIQGFDLGPSPWVFIIKR